VQLCSTPDNFGHYLGTLLEANKLSVLQLAEVTNLEQDFVIRLLSGEQILTADVAFVLAEVFEQSPLWMLEVQRSTVIEARDRRDKSQVAA